MIAKVVVPVRVWHNDDSPEVLGGHATVVRDSERERVCGGWLEFGGVEVTDFTEGGRANLLMCGCGGESQRGDEGCRRAVRAQQSRA